MTFSIPDIFNDPSIKHDLTLFDPEQVEGVERALFAKGKAGKPYIRCLATEKPRPAKPEEIVRQLWLARLLDHYGYEKSRLRVEEGIHIGRQVKRADIVVLDKERTDAPYIILEIKKTKLSDGKDQLKSYTNATGAPIGVWSDGGKLAIYHREDPNYFSELPEIPRADQTVEEIVNEPWSIDTLIQKTREREHQKTLRQIIEEMENEVLANASVDVFEEVFKLIFVKLFDELACFRGDHQHLRFRSTGSDSECRQRIADLFTDAKEEWQGVFGEDDYIRLDSGHLKICVSYLQEYKLFNSNLEVVDEAFEYLVTQYSKGEKGQYFTPRYVIDMCVRMLNPTEEETLIDTAAGSSGFTVHGIFYVWQKILEDMGKVSSHLFTMERKPARCNKYVNQKVFAIDFDERCVRVSRCLNLIAGDGQTNVLHLNTLDWGRWSEKLENENWRTTYNTGWQRLRKLQPKGVKNGDFREFEFDVLMANPPFAGDIKQGDILTRYDLGQKENGKQENAVGRDLLFIERNLDFLRPGGRMAVVLPQGRFNNASDKRLRTYISDRCRILGVVGLHPNTFKPHTGTKTSVLLVQKWNDDPDRGPLCPRVADYNIFFATQQKSGKDTSGDPIYLKEIRVRYPEPHFKTGELEWREYREADFLEKYGSYEEATFVALEDEAGSETTMTVREFRAEYGSDADIPEAKEIRIPIKIERLLEDQHGHFVVDHDLFNHDGLTGEGIAEAFEEFAKKEGLTFFPPGKP